MENQLVMQFQKSEIIELKKHSSLIATSNRNISMPQRKLFNALLYLTSLELKSNPTQQKFHLKFSDVAKFSGYNNFTNTKYLKDCIAELVETTIEYDILGKDKTNEWGVFALISQAVIKSNETHITVIFPPIILENIIYPNIYALLNLSIVNSLDGKYSLPLYELLSDYRKVGSLYLTIPKMKKILGLDENDYPKISNLKKRILDPAVDEINQMTDLEVEYEFDRVDSRSYTHIEFIIKDRNMVLNPVENSAYMLLKSKGLPESTSKKFAKQLSKKNVVEAVESLEKAIKRGSVKNITAYLTKILKNIELEDDEMVELIPQSAQSAPVQLSDYRPITDNPRNNIEYKKYISGRVNDIISNLSMSVFNKFIEEQNNFAIEHYYSKNIIDDNKNIVNLAALSADLVFRGWVINNYLDEEIEFKMFKELNND